MLLIGCTFPYNGVIIRSDVSEILIFCEFVDLAEKMQVCANLGHIGRF